MLHVLRTMLYESTIVPAAEIGNLMLGLQVISNNYFKIIYIFLICVSGRI